MDPTYTDKRKRVDGDTDDETSTPQPRRNPGRVARPGVMLIAPSEGEVLRNCQYPARDPPKDHPCVCDECARTGFPCRWGLRRRPREEQHPPACWGCKLRSKECQIRGVKIDYMDAWIDASTDPKWPAAVPELTDPTRVRAIGDYDSGVRRLTWPEVVPDGRESDFVQGVCGTWAKWPSTCNPVSSNRGGKSSKRPLRVRTRTKRKASNAPANDVIEISSDEGEAAVAPVSVCGGSRDKAGNATRSFGVASNGNSHPPASLDKPPAASCPTGSPAPSADPTACGSSASSSLQSTIRQAVARYRNMPDPEELQAILNQLAAIHEFGVAMSSITSQCAPGIEAMREGPMQGLLRGTDIVKSSAGVANGGCQTSAQAEDLVSALATPGARCQIGPSPSST